MVGSTMSSNQKENLTLDAHLRSQTHTFKQRGFGPRRIQMENQSNLLTPADTWQTPLRGDNDSEYQIYVAAAQDLGWEVKSYNEWLNS